MEKRTKKHKQSRRKVWYGNVYGNVDDEVYAGVHVNVT